MKHDDEESERSSHPGESIQVEEEELPHDSEMHGGIVHNRSCTDVPALIVFVIYIIILVIILGFAVIKADYRKLKNGVDSHGNICGYKNEPIKGSNSSGQDMVSKTYLVSKCDKGNCTSVKNSCEEKCPDGYKVTMFRHCVLIEHSNDTNPGHDSFNAFISDFALFWPYILFLCAATAALSFMTLCALRFLTLCFLWTVLFIFGIALTISVLYLWINTISRLKQSDPVGKSSSLFTAIISTVILIYCFVIVYIARKKMAFVVELIKEVGNALYCMPCIYFLPILADLFQVVIIFFTFGSLASILVSGSPKVNEKGEVDFPIDNFLKVGIALIAVGFIWVDEFIIACQHLVVSGSVSQWYFTRDKKHLESPIRKSINITFKYHLGSAALGSLIITIIKILRQIIENIKNAKNENEGWFIELCVTFIQCCCQCIEDIIKYITRNAYIMISMEGQPFCSSAKKAFQLLSDHLMSLVAVQAAGDALLFACKIAVTIAIGISAYVLIKLIEGITYVFLLVLIVFILAYTICNTFFSIFEMAIDTMLLDYCEDCRRNDGMYRLYYMSDNLKNLAQDANQQFHQPEIPQTSQPHNI